MEALQTIIIVVIGLVVVGGVGYAIFSMAGEQTAALEDNSIRTERVQYSCDSQSINIEVMGTTEVSTDSIDLYGRAFNESLNDWQVVKFEVSNGDLVVFGNEEIKDESTNSYEVILLTDNLSDDFSKFELKTYQAEGTFKNIFPMGKCVLN